MDYSEEHGGFLFTIDEVKDMIQVCKEAGLINCDYDFIHSVREELENTLKKDAIT